MTSSRLVWYTSPRGCGETTLSEGMLYLAGKTQKLGRVDKRCILDTHELEKERGIIFPNRPFLPSVTCR